MIKILNDEPIKESVCKECKEVLRQRRVNLKSKISTYRIWVHKKTKRVECGEKEKLTLQDLRPTNHTEKCVCPNCNQYREMSGI